MPWLLFSFLTAFFESLKDVFSKKSLKELDEYVVAWALRFFALPFLLPILFFVEIPSLDTGFWVALLVSGSLNVATTVLYLKALKCSDLSLTVPMVTFTPLFLLLTSPLIVGEFPSVFGFLGVLLIVLGSYTLNIKERHEGYLQPFRALLKEAGPKLMLLVAFIWSITSNFDKIGIQHSSSIFWAVIVNIFIAVVLLPIMLYKSRKGIHDIRANYKALLPIGACAAATSIFQMVAVSLTLVAYVISIKRTSTVMSVFLGHLIFKEKDVRERLTGAVIMLFGVLCIALS